MRILTPRDAREREENILRIIIQEFVNSRRPVGSEFICKTAGLGLSSATIRNIMKKLEEEGYLYQSHTSGGRIPTDKAYRYYVDYVHNVQRLALEEKDRIEQQYNQKMAEIDKLLAQTSKMLAGFSGSAGFVYSVNLNRQLIRRVDFIPLASGYILAVLVTQSGAVRHCPIALTGAISFSHLRVLASFVNEQVAGLTLEEAERVLWNYTSGRSRDLVDMAELARQFISEIGRQQKNQEELHIEGISSLMEHSGAEDYAEFYDMVRIMEEKERFSSMLGERLSDFQGSSAQSGLRVFIGAENELKELRNMSIVATTYKAGDRALGLLGILGPKHMEYPRMISLVNFVGELVERAISRWDTATNAGLPPDTDPDDKDF